MEIKNPNPQILSAAAAMLATFAPELSPNALLEAIRAYDPSNGKAMQSPVEKPLTRKEVASFLKCSLNTVTRHMNAGRLRRIVLTGRSVRIDPASVKALLKTDDSNVTSI